MTPKALPRHPRFKVTAVITLIVSMLLGIVQPAYADPTPPPPNEGGGKTLGELRSALDAAATNYIQAQARLERAKQRQVEAQQAYDKVIAETEAAAVEVRQNAAHMYIMGRLTPISMMLNARNQDDFLKRLAGYDRFSSHQAALFDKLREGKGKAAQYKDQIDEAIATQQAQTAEMERRKNQAERALALVGGTPTRVDIDPRTLPDASPVARNPDGTFPSESCDQDDPTTSGCLTKRTLWDYNETKKAGFDHYVACFRTGDQYEHPKGRACDWAAAVSTFGGTAKGSEKIYGDRLASFYVKNASALAVMYVVWYCTIWHVATGWRRYNNAGSNCGDDPAGDHTNHVHLSVL